MLTAAWARPGHAACVQTGPNVLCTGFDTDGFLSAEPGLNLTVAPDSLVRNIETGERNGICPLSFPAIALGSDATVGNNGELLTFGVCGTGIQTGARSEITNAGTISTNDVLGIGIDAGINSAVVNTGTITTAQFSGWGIFAGSGSQITNGPSAAIVTGGIAATGVRGGAGVTLINDGMIRTSDNAAQGIDLLGGAQVINRGTIEVGGFQAAAIRLQAGPATVINEGLIRSTYTGNSLPGSPEDGMLIDAGAVSIQNVGTITMSAAGAAGIRLFGESSGGTYSISNSGVIDAPAGALRLGIASGTATVANTGTLTASNESADAILITTAATGRASFTNTGTIMAGPGGAAYRGGLGADEVVNSGTVTGDIFLAGGNDRLTLQTGSNVSGFIDAGTGVDELTLTGSGELSSILTGFEDATKFGTGTWTVATDVTLARTFRILEDKVLIASGHTLSAQSTAITEEGALILAGALASDLTNGGQLTITGNAIITGDYDQAETGRLSMSQNSHSDGLIVTGTARVAGTLSLDMTGRAPISDGDVYTVLSANELQGSFSTLDIGESAFLIGEQVIDPNNGTLSISFSRRAYASAATSVNGMSVAAALDTALTNTPPVAAYPLFSTLDTLTPEAADETFRALSSDLPFVQSELGVLASRTALHALLDTSIKSGQTGWASIGHRSGALGFDQAKHSYGLSHVMAGNRIRTSEDGLLIGGAIGRISTDSTANAAARHTDGDMTFAAVNMSYAGMHWRGAAAFLLGGLKASTARRGGLTGLALYTADGDGTVFAAAVEGQRIWHKDTVAITATAGLTYSRIGLDDLSERQSQLDALEVADFTDESLRPHLNASAEFQFDLIAPRVGITWSMESLSKDRTTQAALAVLPNAPFTLSGPQAKRHWVEAEADLPVEFTDRLTAVLSATRVLNDKSGGTAGRLALIYRW